MLPLAGISITRCCFSSLPLPKSVFIYSLTGSVPLFNYKNENLCQMRGSQQSKVTSKQAGTGPGRSRIRHLSQSRGSTSEPHTSVPATAVGTQVKHPKLNSSELQV